MASPATHDFVTPSQKRKSSEDSSRTQSRYANTPSALNQPPSDNGGDTPQAQHSVGQFSFAPATKTTVVTTTTTTTTAFPPFIMRAPKHLLDRDPERYPLAATPTPRSIKRFRLDIGGQDALFEEANAAEDLMQNVSLLGYVLNRLLSCQS